ncbi:MAG: pilin [bacterium]
MNKSFFKHKSILTFYILAILVTPIYAKADDLPPLPEGVPNEAVTGPGQKTVVLGGGLSGTANNKPADTKALTGPANGDFSGSDLTPYSPNTSITSQHLQLGTDGKPSTTLTGDGTGYTLNLDGSYSNNTGALPFPNSDIVGDEAVKQEKSLFQQGPDTWNWPTGRNNNVTQGGTTNGTANSANICQNGICNYTLLAPIGTFLGNKSNGTVYQFTQDSNSLCKLLNSWFRIGIALAGMLAVVMIVIGGFQYATTDSLFGKSEGRTKVDNALFGLALALGTWLILNTINPALTNCSLDAKATTAINSTVATVSDGMMTGALAGGTVMRNATNGTLDLGSGASYGVKGPGSIVANTQAGLMFPDQTWNEALIQDIKDSGIMNLSPSDSAKYFPNGNPTQDQWASLFVSIANKETTGFNAKDNTVAHKLDGKSSFSSEGLFSLSVRDPEVIVVARNNGVTPQDVLGDPILSIKSSVDIMKRVIQERGYISGPNGYWGPANRGE